MVNEPEICAQLSKWGRPDHFAMELASQMVLDADKMLSLCTPPKVFGSKQSTESVDPESWAIPVAMNVVDSDQDSVDVLRFDEPEGRASWIAGEPPPTQLLRARNTAAVLTAFGAIPVPKSCTVSGTLHQSVQLPSISTGRCTQRAKWASLGDGFD